MGERELRPSAEELEVATSYQDSARGGDSRLPLLRSLLLVTWVQTVATFGSSAFVVIGPFLREEWGLQRAQLGLLATALFAGILPATPLAGLAADRFDEQRLLAGGLVITAGSLLLGSVVGRPALFYLCAFLAGIGYAVIAPAGSRLVAESFSARSRGKAMGLKQMGGALGSGLTALALPFLAEVVGWRVALAAAGLGVLLGVGPCLVRPAARIRERSLQGEEGRGTLSAHALLWPMAVYGFLGMTLMGSQYVLNGYLLVFLNESTGYSFALGGVLLSLLLWSGAAGRPLWGWFSDNLLGARREVTLALLALGTGGMGFAFSLFASRLGLPALVVVLLVLGLLNFGWNGLFIVGLVELNPDASGFVSGVGLTFSSLGGLAVPPLFGWVVDRTHSYPLGWSLIYGMVVLGGLLLAFRAFQVSTARARVRHAAATGGGLNAR